MATIAPADRDHVVHTVRAQHLGDATTFTINGRQITGETRESTTVLYTSARALTVCEASLLDKRDTQRYVVVEGDLDINGPHRSTAALVADAKSLDGALEDALRRLL